MANRWRLSWLAGLAGVATLFLALTGLATAEAQYPPPVGSLQVASSATTVPPGDETEISATVLDNNGDPAAGVEVLFEIVSQPGDDAFLVDPTAESDSQGVARTLLRVGSTGGEIVVQATAGELIGVTTVHVVAGVAAGPGIPTGDGSVLAASSGGGLRATVGWAVAGLAALLLGMAAWSVATAQRR